MTSPIIRPAFSHWQHYDRLLRERVAALTEEQLAIQPAPGRWPLWATIGHLACQRVFGFCDFAGEPGAESSPFPNAGYDCPGDDDLENAWSAERLVDALERTFAIVEHALDTWTIDSLGEVISHPEWGPDWVRSRGEIILRGFAHDVSHISELNDALGRAGLDQVDIWR